MKWRRRRESLFAHTHTQREREREREDEAATHQKMFSYPPSLPRPPTRLDLEREIFSSSRLPVALFQKWGRRREEEFKICLFYFRGKERGWGGGRLLILIKWVNCVCVWTNIEMVHCCWLKVGAPQPKSQIKADADWSFVRDARARFVVVVVGGGGTLSSSLLYKWSLFSFYGREDEEMQRSNCTHTLRRRARGGGEENPPRRLWRYKKALYCCSTLLMAYVFELLLLF